MAFLSSYPFVTLCLVLSLMAACMGLLRRDLLPAMGRTALLSLPFAFAEPLFYGSYWRPPLLFGLGESVGFGLEDFWFVGALGALALGCGFAFRGQTLRRDGSVAWTRLVWRAAAILGSSFLLVAVLTFLGVPAIFSAPVLMVLVSVVLLLLGHGSAAAALQGGIVTFLLYGLACALLGLLVPDVFARYWSSPSQVLFFGMGLPLEELLYGFAAGVGAAVVCPFCLGFRAEAISLPWLQASRLPSQAYIFFPILFGQAVYAGKVGVFDWLAALPAWGFSLCIQLYIVYANDYADARIDGTNQTFTPFSGGSRVLVEGKLTRGQLKRAALIMAVCALALSLFFVPVFGNGWPLLFGVLGILLLWGYSFAPLRLSYRGGGELLQMLGVGVVLPFYGYVSQSGGVAGFPLVYFAPLLPLQLACALSTALPDAPSDQAGGKRTFAVLLGSGAVKSLVIGLYGMALGLYVWLWSDALGYLLLPGAAWVGLIAVAPRARPGSVAMFVLVLFSNLTTIAFMVALTAQPFRAAGQGV